MLYNVRKSQHFPFNAVTWRFLMMCNFSEKSTVSENETALRTSYQESWLRSNATGGFFACSYFQYPCLKENITC